MARDVAGDQSTDRFIFSSPDSDGVRAYTLVDSYGSFCETDGPGTGAVLTAKGTATISGSTVTILTNSYVCANGQRGQFDPPLYFEATLTGDGLDFHYYVAERVGD